VTTQIAIRREDMYEWERRVPLVPEDVRGLIGGGLSIRVQRSTKRAFSEEEYREAGCTLVDEVTGVPLVIGLKEVPVDAFERDTVYVFFSHTIKGQPANMPMLRRVLDLGCTIIDYERIVDDEGRRLIFFGNYAGYAGAIDTLWTLGRRLAAEGVASPFEAIRQASEYASLDDAKQAVKAVGEEIRRNGLPEAISPLVIGVAGYGNVSQGAQAILDLLPIAETSPADLIGGTETGGEPIRKVVFREEDTVLRLDPSAPFDLQEYYDRPERYRGAFERYLPKLDVLINCIYWEAKYPRLVTKDAIRSLYAEGRPRLRVIGDISCDVEGGVETTVKATEPDDPIYVYLPEEDRAVSGVEGSGPVVMAVDILPSELPREASTYFSKILTRYIPQIAAADFTVGFEELDLPAELKRAVIAYRGDLAPAYRHLEEHLGSAERPGS